MSLKILLPIAAIVFIGSIAFSFYFSQTIVQLNASFQTNQALQNKLLLQQQSLLSDFLTLSEIKPSDFPDLAPVTKIENLSP